MPPVCCRPTLCDGGEQELVLRAQWASQSKAIEPEDSLEMGE
jgi:hypothetical protein